MIFWKLIIQIIEETSENERTTTERYNGKTKSRFGKNAETTDTTVEENGENHDVDGGQQIFIYILLGVAIIIFSAILCVVIKIMKKKRITETTTEENVNYGRPSDFEQYYEEEKSAKIVDTNDYYK